MIANFWSIIREIKSLWRYLKADNDANKKFTKQNNPIDDRQNYTNNKVNVGFQV